MVWLKPVYKFHVDPVPSRRGRVVYSLTVYEHGFRMGYYKPIVRLEYPRYFFRYKQSLIEYGFVGFREKIVRVRGTGQEAEKLTVIFYEGSERFAEIYRLFLLSILNIRSARRIDKLAKCFANLDPISPVLDTLITLQKITTLKRFTQILRGYCLCLK